MVSGRRKRQPMAMTPVTRNIIIGFMLLSLSHSSSKGVTVEES
jgi:hypothetical protein